MTSTFQNVNADCSDLGLMLESGSSAFGQRRPWLQCIHSLASPMPVKGRKRTTTGIASRRKKGDNMPDLDGDSRLSDLRRHFLATSTQSMPIAGMLFWT